jgi:hypothetical protein
MTSRTDAGAGGEVDGGSRDSLETQARLGLHMAGGVLALSGRMSRGDGFVPITPATRGPADKRAPYEEWSTRGHWVAPLGRDVEVQANLAGFHDWRTRGTEFSADRTNGADASLRLVGQGSWRWSMLGYWQWRDLMSSTASVSAGRTSARACCCRMRCRRAGLAEVSRLGRPCPGEPS